MSFFTNAGPVRKFFLALGGLTFVAGVTLLAVGGYSALQDDEEEQPDIPIVDVGTIETPTPTAPPATTAAPTPVPTPPLEGAYTMIIPKLGVNAPVAEYGLDAQAVPEVPTGDNAADIVAWYNFSAEPGAGSNAVFAGHVTWFGAAVFYDLPSIVAGDEVRLKDQQGTEMLYIVSEVFQVDPDDPDSLNVMKGTPTDMITIITCDGDYSDTGDPIFGGDYSHRLVVRANLQSIAPAAAVTAQ